MPSEINPATPLGAQPSGLFQAPTGLHQLGRLRGGDPHSELSRYLNVLIERRYLLAVVLLCGLLLAVVWTSTQPKIYEARTAVVVEATLPQVLGSEVRDVYDPSPGSFYMVQDYLQTSRRVIQSDGLARRAAARLRLDQEPGFWGDGPSPKSLDQAGQALLGTYSAEVIAETRILQITARHTKPEWAKKIADAVADEFVEGNQQRRDSSTQIAAQQLADELDRLRKGLHEAELAIFDFKTKHDMLSVSLEDKANQVARQIDRYTDALTEIRLRKIQRGSQVEELRKLREADPLEIPTPQLQGGENSLIPELRRLYVEEARRLAELLARYQEDHPQAQQQRSKLEQVRKELRREAQAAQGAAQQRYNEAVRDEAKVLEQVEKVKQEGLRLTRLEIEYNRLKRDADSLQKQYTLVLNRTKEAGMVGRLKLNNLAILDYARLPQAPVSPRLRTALGVALLLSSLLGVLLCFALEALDRSVKGQEDVENRLMLPFLGMLPRLDTADRGPGEQGTPRSPDLYVAHYPRSTVAEACRTIRTNVLFLGTERPLRKILVTSSVAREGKTLSCVSLGVVLAQGGARTLLIDCDLRRPRVQKALGLREPVGLTNVLLGDVQVEDAVRKTEVENLWVLPSGPVPPNPAELLDGTHFRELLERLAERYDRVLLDSPPAIPVTDPAVLSTLVDGVVLVVRHAVTPRDAVRRAAKHILDVGGRIIGVVLNDIDTTAKGYRSYYGAYNYYREEEGEEKGEKNEKGGKRERKP